MSVLRKIGRALARSVVKHAVQAEFKSARSSGKKPAQREVTAGRGPRLGPAGIVDVLVSSALKRGITEPSALLREVLIPLGSVNLRDEVSRELSALGSLLGELPSEEAELLLRALPEIEALPEDKRRQLAAEIVQYAKNRKENQWPHSASC